MRADPRIYMFLVAKPGELSFLFAIELRQAIPERKTVQHYETSGAQVTYVSPSGELNRTFRLCTLPSVELQTRQAWRRDALRATNTELARNVNLLAKVNDSFALCNTRILR